LRSIDTGIIKRIMNIIMDIIKSVMKRRMAFSGRRAQVHLTETIAILFIFFILVGLGISFYGKYKSISFVEQQEEQLQARAIRTTLRAIFLPELLCSRGSAEPEENCMDVVKAREFSPQLQDQFDDYYFEMFSYANITLQQVYPSLEKIPLYVHVPETYEQRETTFFVMALRDETKGERGVPSYGFGYLRVEVFS